MNIYHDIPAPTDYFWKDEHSGRHSAQVYWVLEVYPLYNCLGKFSFPSPMSNSISLPGRFSGWSWSGGGQLSTIPGHPSRFATPIPNSNPSTCYMYFPATLAIRAACICPTSMNISLFQRCRFWWTNLGACRLQCQCQVHVTKWRLGFSPDIFSVSRWFLRNSCSFQMVVWFFCLEAKVFPPGLQVRMLHHRCVEPGGVLR